MANRYNQGTNFNGVTRFTESPMAEVEFSRMTSPCRVLTDLNAGDILPVLCLETLPHDTFEIDFNYINRLLSATYVPFMGELIFDLYAFHVPNRVVNDSWRNVLGENSSGFWSAPEIELAPLLALTGDNAEQSTKISVGSIADYYDIPTQQPIPNVILAQMNDLWARGYLSCYNEYFRDQNYMSPLSYSKLNIYNGFLESVGSYINSYNGSDNGNQGSEDTAISDSTGSYSSGALGKAILGEGGSGDYELYGYRVTNFSVLDKPLKACKLHDPFTSALPSPQKGSQVIFNAAELPVEFSLTNTIQKFSRESGGYTSLNFNIEGGPSTVQGTARNLVAYKYLSTGTAYKATVGGIGDNDDISADINGWNLKAVASGISITVDELRTAIATQQVLEALATGGSRYWEFLKTFFNIEVGDPFPDIPTQIGHFRSTLDMYQVAQTSASTEDSPQGSLAGFGYSTSGAGLLTKTFLEHGFIHIFAIVRHKSQYTTYTPPHLFRRGTLDFYLPQFANISEQPIRLATLNPFRTDSLERALGFQEAWSLDYRYDPDRIRGTLRCFPDDSEDKNSLDVWHLGNYFDPDFTHVNADWLKSDTQEILDRTLRVTSANAPQFLLQIDFKITKQRPMPVYSVPGLDTI